MILIANWTQCRIALLLISLTCMHVSGCVCISITFIDVGWSNLTSDGTVPWVLCCGLMKLGGRMPLCSLMWPDAPRSCCPDSPLWWVCPRRVNRDRLSLLSQASVGVIPHQPQPQHYSEVIWKCRLCCFHFCFLLTIFFLLQTSCFRKSTQRGAF